MLSRDLPFDRIDGTEELSAFLLIRGRYNLSIRVRLPSDAKMTSQSNGHSSRPSINVTDVGMQFDKANRSD
jgi:hypothetical protein